MVREMARVALVSDGVRALGLSLSLVVAGAACTTNHDALARQPSGGSSGGGTGGGAGFGNSSFGNTGNQDQGGRYNPDYEPPGDDALTIVNGAIDAPSVALCFARVSDDGETSELVGSPLPALAYGASTVLTELDGLSLIDDEIQPWVIAGDLARIKKLDCADAVDLARVQESEVTPVEVPLEGAGGAGGAGSVPTETLEMPALRARPLAALPPGTVNIGRSILMVLSGCLGGAYYRDKLDTSACGGDYTPEEPNVAPIVVTLSRELRFDKVGLQGVNALPATPVIDLKVTGDRGNLSLPFATSVQYGTIEPRPADVRFAPTELAVDSSSAGLQVLDESGGALYELAWTDIFASSGISTLSAARTYTAIALGPDPLLIKKGWWNKATFAVVDNDPTRE